MPDWIDNVARQHLSKDYAKVDLAQNLANKSAKTIKHYVASVPYFQRVDAIISLRKYLDIFIFFQWNSIVPKEELSSSLRQKLRLLTWLLVAIHPLPTCMVMYPNTKEK